MSTNSFVTTDTPIGGILHSSKADSRLREYMELVYSGNNVPWMLERNREYSRLMNRGYRSIGEIIEFLEGFSMIKTCGVLHERDHSVNRKHHHAGHCPAQKGNICCTHPEESGLLFGIFSSMSIIQFFYPERLNMDHILELIAELRKFDREVSRKDRNISYWTKEDITKGESAELRRSAISTQRDIGTPLSVQIALIIGILKEIVVSQISLPDTLRSTVLPDISQQIAVIMTGGTSA